MLKLHKIILKSWLHTYLKMNTYPKNGCKKFIGSFYNNSLVRFGLGILGSSLNCAQEWVSLKLSGLNSGLGEIPNEDVI
jgi:hypothetical protein